MHIWLGNRDHGSLVDPSHAAVSVLDHGFTVGDGVFETLKVTAAGPFALTRHLRRLAASARALGLPEPRADVVREAVDCVLAAGVSTVGHMGRLRVTYTAGAAPLGSERGAVSPTLVVMLAPAAPWPDTSSVVTVPWSRNERSALMGVKSTSYAENVIALHYAHERGASEAVFANTRGELCEGTGSNVFVVLGGEVLTPPLTSGCLGGITRELVLEFLGGAEADLGIDVLQHADEVFITSSTRDVHPVTRADDRHWERQGPVATRLRAEFAELAASRLDP